MTLESRLDAALRHSAAPQRQPAGGFSVCGGGASVAGLQRPAGRRLEQWRQGAKEGEGGDDWRLGEVLPSLLLAGLLQVVGDAIMRSRSGSQ